MKANEVALKILAPGVRNTENPGDKQIVCPQCQVRGQVNTFQGRVKCGVSGGKLTAAILTLGISLLFTGLSRKEWVTFAHCDNCGSDWTF